MNLIKKSWSKKDYEEFLEYLYSLKDVKYLNFNQKIITTNYEMIGIRIPLLRKISKEIVKGNYQEFLNYSFNKYYEEIMIQGLVIAQEMNIKKLKENITRYLDYIDNWAICDTFCNSLKIIKRKREEFWDFLVNLINSKEEFKMRFAIVIFLNYYLDDKYILKIFTLLPKIKTNLYYVNMGIAWLLCECYTFYPKETYEFLENSKLNSFIIKMTISKINDSYRIKKEQKKQINALKSKLLASNE